MGDTGIDAVAICSSTDTHVDLLVRAAEAGKAIFCEKPISLDLDEVTSALDAVAAAGVPLQIGFNRRFDPGHRSVRDAVASGALGSLHLVRISSRDPAPPPIEYVAVSGGIFLDMTGHDFDMARFVTGSEVVELYAQGSVNITPEIAQYGDVDTAVVQLRHASDVLTVIDNSRRAVYGYDQRVEAFGAAGLAASDNVPVHGAIIRRGGRTHGGVALLLHRTLRAELHRRLVVVRHRRAAKAHTGGQRRGRAGRARHRAGGTEVVARTPARCDQRDRCPINEPARRCLSRAMEVRHEAHHALDRRSIGHSNLRTHRSRVQPGHRRTDGRGRPRVRRGARRRGRRSQGCVPGMACDITVRSSRGAVPVSRPPRWQPQGARLDRHGRARQGARPTRWARSPRDSRTSSSRAASRNC